MSDREDLDLAASEAVRYRDTDRHGDDLVVTDERILVRRGGDSVDVTLAVPLESVAELTRQRLDWFLVILGLAIVGFGVVSVDRHLLLATGFVVAGLASLALTWYRRDRVRIHAHARPKPISVYPTDVDAFLAAVDEVLEPYREERPPERASHGVDVG